MIHIYTEMSEKQSCPVEKGCPHQDMVQHDHHGSDLDKTITIKLAHCRCELVSSRKPHAKHLTANRLDVERRAYVWIMRGQQTNDQSPDWLRLPRLVVVVS